MVFFPKVWYFHLIFCSSLEVSFSPYTQISIQETSGRLPLVVTLATKNRFFNPQKFVICIFWNLYIYYPVEFDSNSLVFVWMAKSTAALKVFGVDLHRTFPSFWLFYLLWEDISKYNAPSLWTSENQGEHSSQKIILPAVNTKMKRTSDEFFFR